MSSSINIARKLEMIKKLGKKSRLYEMPNKAVT